MSSRFRRQSRSLVERRKQRWHRLRLPPSAAPFVQEDHLVFLHPLPLLQASELTPRRRLSTPSRLRKGRPVDNAQSDGGHVSGRGEEAQVVVQQHSFCKRESRGEKRWQSGGYHPNGKDRCEARCEAGGWRDPFTFGSRLSLARPG